VKIVKVAPLTLTVELDPTDCIALYVACARVTAHGDAADPGPHLDAIGAALLLALLAIGDRDMDEGPLTLAQMWRVWAPLVSLHYPHYGRLPVPQEYED